ncbi:response regulator [Aerosakkonemataceae cyanobacterium BLCC-F154]|uniref:Response regulator n=1 Tax=Floridaenema fluviatile BLCC-F154 TaxID=3153640 RepID=A0ABV4YN12_9CYAN
MTDRTILVVDDEVHLRELVQACLEDLGGWNTVAAATGEECLQIVQTQNFDAILLDVSMPGMDGYEVYQKLQSNPKSKSIPVIFLTARVLPSDRDRFRNMSITGVITKPVQPLTLTQEIREILGW